MDPDDGTSSTLRQVTSFWKPILIYSKGAMAEATSVARRVPSEKEKEWHDWQQPLEEVETIVQVLQ